MNESRWQWLGLSLAASLVIPGVFLAAAPAVNRPGIGVTLATTTPSGSSTTLVYHASVDASECVTPSDFFRIHDLAGYVEGSAEGPPGWKVTADQDNVAGKNNLTFTYAGPEPITGPMLIKGFSARSTSGKPRAIRRFVGRVTRATGPDAGTKVASAGDVFGPGAVPEPASLLSTTVGVLILGVVYAQRHRRKLLLAE